MSAEGHLKEAKRLYQKALLEFQRAKEQNDGAVLRDACGKGWLSAIEATHTLFIKRGVNGRKLPRSDRGRRFMVDKYAERELRWLYFSLRESLHIEGYYDGALSFDEVKLRLDDLNIYIEKIEGVNNECRGTFRRS